MEERGPAGEVGLTSGGRESQNKYMTIYFDNAATSWPKPPAVMEAMARFMDEIGANPGRSGHRRSIDAARILYDAREALAACFNVKDPLRIVFTLNATESVNLALKGLLRPGDHVVTSGMEHNAVMRPLRDLEKRGVSLTVVPCSEEGLPAPEAIGKAIRAGTKLVVLTHASNVTGGLLPVAEAGRICRERGALLLVDAAQTAGAYPIDVERDGIDLLAFTGHKSLYGPQGTGGLVIGARVDEREMVPLKQGGTGSRSESEEQPDFLPDRFESGTPNGVGIAGLLAGVAFVRERTVEVIRRDEMVLAEGLIEGLRRISRVRVHGPARSDRRVATLSFTLEGCSPSEAAFRLEREYGVLCRPGLHCAPAAHRTLGTFPNGTIRFSLSLFTTEEEVEAAVAAVAAVAGGA
jgi:cysteine desulfurase / selenocysteine lyase